MTPRTKVCEAGNDSGTTGQGKAQNKEVSLDKLEVGDHVEVAFVREAHSARTRAPDRAHAADAWASSHVCWLRDVDHHPGFARPRATSLGNGAVDTRPVQIAE